MFRRHPGLNRKVLVNLYSGNAIEGVLTKKTRDLYLVRAAVLHEPGSEPVPADGEIVIEPANVDYVQLLG
ncbi:hypothetical protein [Mycolicibacterium peregrinum]|uniref:hypothetical protein n=1 Tax=Mycolicibacterium peregrinum TaxID=43304 RepID=UPI003AAEA9CC